MFAIMNYNKENLIGTNNNDNNNNENNDVQNKTKT